MSVAATASGRLIALTIGSVVSLIADGPVTLRNPGGGQAGIHLANGAVAVGRFNRGSAVATPTVAGALGEYFTASGAAFTSSVSGWICTTAGSAGSAVWTPRL
jgi:hypothetical protein